MSPSWFGMSTVRYMHGDSTKASYIPISARGYGNAFVVVDLFQLRRWSTRRGTTISVTKVACPCHHPTGLPHRGQTKPCGQRNFSKYSRQAASLANGRETDPRSWIIWYGKGILLVRFHAGILAGVELSGYPNMDAQYHAADHRGARSRHFSSLRVTTMRSESLA
jgi:hypothetical protein